jgi:hypothetical protein
MAGGRLPDGKETRSDREYVDEWRKFAAPICEATDTALYALDPGISIRTKGKYSKVVALPGWFVHRLNAKLAKSQQRLEALEAMLSRFGDNPDRGEITAARTAIAAAKEQA